jgi:23S rRNA U2552 (ribose-2'-O)-methylase RlmE/FtsJ
MLVHCSTLRVLTNSQAWQIVDKMFAMPFKEALHSIMADHHLRKGNVVHTAFTETILIDFKNDLQRRFAAFYDGAQTFRDG